jgi:hypothetical protein
MTAESATFNDWEVPPGFDDNDDGDTAEALLNRWCLSPNVYVEGTNTAVDPRACSEIKCHMQRKLATGDDKDFNFEVGNDSRTTDYMLIKPGRARVFINNETTYATGFGNSENFNRASTGSTFTGIEVIKGAF